MNCTDFIDISDIEAGEEIIIYGYGSLGIGLFEMIQNANKQIKVIYFLDSYKNTRHKTTPVRAIDAVPASDLKKHTIVIASIFWQEILKTLRKLNISNAKVYNPNMQEHKPHFDMVVKLASEADHRDIQLLDRQEEAHSQQKIVFHAAAKFESLNLSGTIAEVYVNHNNPIEIRTTLERFKNCKTIVLDADRHVDFNFYHTIIKSAPRDTSIRIAAPKKKHSMAFVMEHIPAIYFPIYKCATTTILSALQSAFDTGCNPHYFTNTASKLQFIDIDTLDLDKYFKFTFMRDPLQRAFSFYSSLFQNGLAPLRKTLSNHFNTDDFSFHDYAHFVANCIDPFSDEHFRSQCDFITNADGDVIVDYIGTLENFEQDWRKISKTLNIQNTIQIKNASSPQPGQSLPRHTDTTRQLLRKRYEKDYALLAQTGKMLSTYRRPRTTPAVMPPCGPPGPLSETALRRTSPNAAERSSPLLDQI
ncbi:MAG: sulfotransferase family 2 domain-containing protein [Solidesulfovibrio sp.]